MTTPSTRWQVLLQPPQATSPLADVLRQVLKTAGYTAYDPFPGGTGAPIGKISRLRLFATPASEAWQRIIIGDSLDPELIAQITIHSQHPLIDVRLLSENGSHISVYEANGQANSNLDALSPFLKNSATLADLLQATQMPIISAEPASNSTLPAELQNLAQKQGVSMKHVDKLMGKFNKKIFGKTEDGASNQAQGMATLSATQANIDWNTGDAQHLRAIMGCLTVPETWYLPEYATLAGAYQLARQLQRGASLDLPSDQATLAKLPNAGDYTLLYYYKRNS